MQDDTEYVKSTRQWGTRYDERNARNAYEDESRPFEDEFGNEIPHNAVERFVENHGIKPAQPGGGLGPRGNDIVPVEDELLAGLPDEDKERRRRERKNRKKEFGSGLEAADREEMDRSAGRDPLSEIRNSSLVADLDDPDRGSSNGRLGGGGSGGRRDPRDYDFPDEGRRGSNGFTNYNNSSMASDYSHDSGSNSRFGGLGAKKSGRSKKSERYGLAADHRDLSANNPYASSGSRSNKDRSTYSSNNPYRSGRNGGSSSDRYSSPADNDRYDIRNSSERRRGASNDDEDFLNHQF